MSEENKANSHSVSTAATGDEPAIWMVEGKDIDGYDKTWFYQPDSPYVQAHREDRNSKLTPLYTRSAITINAAPQDDCHMSARAQGQRSGKSLDQHEAGLPAGAAPLWPDSPPRWVLCSERMPQWVNGKYLCWFQEDFAVLDLDVQCGWFWGNGSIMEREYQQQVTHWMELPCGPSSPTPPDSNRQA